MWWFIAGLFIGSFFTTVVLLVVMIGGKCDDEINKEAKK